MTQQEFNWLVRAHDILVERHNDETLDAATREEARENIAVLEIALIMNPPVGREV